MLMMRNISRNTMKLIVSAALRGNTKVRIAEPSVYRTRLDSKDKDDYMQ